MSRVAKKMASARFEMSDEEVYREIINAPGALYDYGDASSMVRSFREGLAAGERVSQARIKRRQQTEKSA